MFGPWGTVLAACVVASVLKEIFFRWQLGSARLSVTFFTIIGHLTIMAYITPTIPLINFLLTIFTLLGLIMLWLNKNAAHLEWLKVR